MYRAELQKLEGVWNGLERVMLPETPFEAQARLMFQTAFDGKFLLCDYVLTLPDRTTNIGHGVFRKDERTNILTVTWFRSPVATRTQQMEATADGDRLVFAETIAGRSTRTAYSVALNRLSIRTDVSTNGSEWTPIFDGTYRRR